MDFQHQPERTDLLAEELTDAEVRMLLERLGSREFGGSENSTLGAVVEATGSDAGTVGRLLAEIRRESFESLFGRKLADHETRILSLEQGRQVSHPPITQSKLIEEERSPNIPPVRSIEPTLAETPIRALERRLHKSRRVRLLGSQKEAAVADAMATKLIRLFLVAASVVFLVGLYKGCNR